MHSLDVLDAIVLFLQEKLSDLLLKTKEEDVLKPPTIYDGYLPAKKNISRRGEDDPEHEDYPFVIVRYISEKDEVHVKKTINFKLLIGVYNKDEQHGWRDALALMNRIELLLKETQIIGAASLTGDVEKGLFEEQMKPMWHGVMEVTFELPQVQTKWSVLEDEF